VNGRPVVCGQVGRAARSTDFDKGPSLPRRPTTTYMLSASKFVSVARERREEEA
jgi:hypothetical protein